MISLEGVGKVYRSGGVFGPRRETRALGGIDLEIGPGAFGLLGLNGAGKTTSIKLMATLLRPSEGRLRIAGLDPERDRRAIRSRINMITGSERSLYFRLSGRENLLYFAALYGLSARAARRRSEELLELVGLEGAAGERVERYSRGMKQRLAIARGLVNDPEYLFLDEPTLGLDVGIARELRSFIRERVLSHPGRTLVLTSHYMAEVEELCGRIGILKRGRLAFVGELAGLYARLGLGPVHRFVLAPAGEEGLRRALGGEARIEGLADGRVQASLGAAEGAAAGLMAGLREAGLCLLGYSLEKPSLEEAILRLEGEEAA